MTKTDIEKLYEIEPELTTNGVGGYKTAKISEEHIPEIKICMDWLLNQQYYKTMNKTLSSYYLKHIVERHYGTYVCNGSFIAAVILLGIKYKKDKGGANIYIPIKGNNYY